MEEAVANREFADVGNDGFPRHASGHATEIVTGRDTQGRIFRLVGEESPDVEVSFEFLPGSRLVLERRPPCGGLLFDVVERVLLHGVEVGPGDCDLQHRLVVEQAGLTGRARVLVAFSKHPARRLVVAGERLVRVGRDAVRHDRGVENADETVAELDVGIEERQRFPGFHCLDPKRGSAELHRKGVSVDAMYAVTDHVPQSVLAGRLVRGVGSGVDPRHLCGHAARCREEKVSRTAGRVDNAEIEDGFAGILWMAVYGIGEHGVEGRLHQFVHERRRGVVRPGQLTF